MEEKLVFKNKGLRKLCIISISVCWVIAAAYVAAGIINFSNCTNVPRFVWRTFLMLVYTVEFSLFANRSSIYMELGGDFSLARRSSMFMLMSLLVSAIVEAYYVTVYISLFGIMRIAVMCIIMLIGAVVCIPIARFQYLNFDINGMLPSAVFGVFSAIAMLGVDVLLIGYGATRVGASLELFSILSRIMDSVAPVYISYIPVCLILFSMTKIVFDKEMKLNAKLAPPSMGGTDEKDENLEDL